jgi:hypothetical protein
MIAIMMIVAFVMLLTCAFAGPRSSRAKAGGGEISSSFIHHKDGSFRVLTLWEGFRRHIAATFEPKSGFP